MDIFNSCKFVVSIAKDVKIDEDNIKKQSFEIFRDLKSGKYDLNSWKQCSLHPQIADNFAIDWIFLLDSLNFSFWSDTPFAVTYNGVKYTGYMALCAAVKRAIEKGIPLTNSDFFFNITEDSLKNILAADIGSFPMLKERVEVLREVGTVLKEKFNGSFRNCIIKSNYSAIKLLQIILDNFPSFRDEATYEGQKVYFHKRAQILIADVYSCFENKGLGHFEDIDCITAFADYRVPQILEYMGVLKYSNELITNLKNRVLLNGEPYEVEIRAATICAVEMIKQTINQLAFKESIKGSFTLNSIIIDYYLWQYKNRPSVTLNIPIHKVRSIYY